MTILGWIALVMMLGGLVWAGIDIGKDARRYPPAPPTREMRYEDFKSET